MTSRRASCSYRFVSLVAPIVVLGHIAEIRCIQSIRENEQIIPYGMDLVKAPQFWNHYGSRGAGINVCVIDSGLRATREDLE